MAHRTRPTLRDWGGCPASPKASLSRLWSLVAASALFAATGWSNTVSVIYNFTGQGMGVDPWGELTRVGTKFYGMTRNGGANGGGVIFSIDLDGSNYSVEHTFTQNAHPPQSLALGEDGVTVYGMTSGDGAYTKGTAFKFNTNTNAYTVLHEFGETGDGYDPRGSPTVSGSTLYGTTFDGGNYGRGAVFRMGTDGSNYDILRSFQVPDLEGQDAYGTLALSDSTLYGITQGGGFGYGTMFSMHTDGTGYDQLYRFRGYANEDGQDPVGSLLMSGTMLYGTASNAGLHDGGILFQYDLTGGGYSVLHHFGATAAEGKDPRSELLLYGTKLYGMTHSDYPDTTGDVLYMTSPRTPILWSMRLRAAPMMVRPPTLVAWFSTAPSSTG